MMKDKILGELEFDRYVWWRSMNKSMFGADVVVELLVQDENQEGILDVQRKAYQTYLENEERYIKEVPNYLIDYYKWKFEEINKAIELEEGDQKDTITEKAFFEICKVFFLFICRDGSFGWILGSSWSKEDIAVLFSEQEPRIITRNELRYLHKLKDKSFDTLIHDGEKYWTTWDKMPFYDELVNIRVEVEGSVDEGVNVAQQKAYAQYLLNKNEYLKRLSDYMLPVYLGSRSEAEKVIASGQKVGVKTILPKRLVIDKKGNYGWICYTQWDDSYVGVLLSEEKIQIMTENQLREFEKQEKVKDELFGYLFREFHGWGKTEFVRFFKGEVQTLPLRIRTYDEDVNGEQKAAYAAYLKHDASFWDGIKDELLAYYLEFYDDFEEYLDMPDTLTKKNVNRDNVVSILTFTKLFIGSDARIAWLCESPTEEDGLAFEFTDGKIKQIFQPEII